MNSQDRSLQKWTPASTPRPALDQLNVCPSLDAAVARSDCCSFPEQLAAVSWPVLRSCSSRARPTPTPSRTSTMRWFTIRRFCSRACEACEAILRSTLTSGRVRLSSCRSSCSALLRQGRLFRAGQERALGSRAAAPGGDKRVRWGNLCPWEARSYSTRCGVPASCTHAPRGADASGHGAHACEAIATGRRCSSYRKARISACKSCRRLYGFHEQVYATSRSPAPFVGPDAPPHPSQPRNFSGEARARERSLPSCVIDFDLETPFKMEVLPDGDSPPQPYLPQTPESLFYLLL